MKRESGFQFAVQIMLVFLIGIHAHISNNVHAGVLQDKIRDIIRHDREASIESEVLLKKIQWMITNAKLIEYYKNKNVSEYESRDDLFFVYLQSDLFSVNIGSLPRDTIDNLLARVLTDTESKILDPIGLKGVAEEVGHFCKASKELLQDPRLFVLAAPAYLVGALGLSFLDMSEHRLSDLFIIESFPVMSGTGENRMIINYKQITGLRPSQDLDGDPCLIAYYKDEFRKYRAR